MKKRPILSPEAFSPRTGDDPDLCAGDFSDFGRFPNPPHSAVSRRGFRLFFLLSLSLPLIFSFAGCKRAVEVEVSMVTEGTQNVKLGPVEIGVYSREKLAEALTPFFHERDEEARRLDALCKAGEKECTAANQRATAAQAAVGASEEARTREFEELEKTVTETETQVDRYIVDARLKASATGETIAEFRKKLIPEEFSALEFMTLYKYDKAPLRNRFEGARKALSGEYWAGVPAMRDAALKAIAAADEADDRYQKALAEVEDAEKASRSAQAQLKDSSEALLRGKAMAPIFAQLPPPEVSAKTDPEGRCRLLLRRGGDWVIVAHAERTEGDKPEQFWWRMDLSKKPPGEKVVLSTSNLLKTAAKEQWLE